MEKEGFDTEAPVFRSSAGLVTVSEELVRKYTKEFEEEQFRCRIGVLLGVKNGADRGENLGSGLERDG